MSTALAIAPTHQGTPQAERVDAQGTMWRLRSLMALGHSTPRIAWALGIGSGHVEYIISGRAVTVAAQLARNAQLLWGAWWDKTPPVDTPARRLSAQRARRRARRAHWCCPAGLDETKIDTPGTEACYVNWEPWCQALGRGIADANPLHLPVAGDVA